MRLILASQSPRRREMLALMGYAYEIVVSDADEHVPPCAPAEFVERLALRKAEAVFASYGDCCVVGADTIVYLDGSIIGKPADASDAFRILRTLSGRTHTVYTGVAVLSGTRRIVFHDAAEVTFAPLSDEEIHGTPRGLLFHHHRHAEPEALPCAALRRHTAGVDGEGA